MSGAREAILAAVRAARPAGTAEPIASSLPAADSGAVPPAALRARFAAALGEAGGVMLPLADAADLGAALEARHAGAARELSTVEGVASRGPALAPGADPHEAADLVLRVAPGRFAVAENGAVWVEEPDPARAAGLFLAEHLVLVVRAADLLGDMHDAYARLASAPLPDWGCFVAGPSKTADIEQCLVIGAHGPRSLAVALLG